MKHAKKHPTSFFTYRPPFNYCADLHAVTDADGNIIAHFEPNEQILTGKTTATDAGLVVSWALNAYLTKGGAADVPRTSTRSTRNSKRSRKAVQG